MKLWKFVWIALMAGILVVFACSEEETPTDPGGGADPNVFCNEGLCVGSAALKQQCVDAFNTCIANNPNINEDECVATALLICH